MEINFLALIVSALVPIAMGFVWYHKSVFGKAWMEGAGMTEEKMKGGNMALIFGLAIFFSLILAFSMSANSVHDSGVAGAMYYATNGTMMPEAGSELANWFDYFKNNLAADSYNFKHGAAHGLFMGLFLILPVVATNAVFERRGWKYTAINVGYWIVCLILMGGILAAWR